MTQTTKIPSSYRPLLDPMETEKAIKQIKDFFQTSLSASLHLRRVTAPLFVQGGSGINDDLNGIERPVSFNPKHFQGVTLEIIQSLAKWKRLALADLAVPEGEGIYADMNAIRPDEDPSPIHSLYVDQWDWEKVIGRNDRNLTQLLNTTKQIYTVLKMTEGFVHQQYPSLKPWLPENIACIHTQELEDRYPELTPKERENAVCREHKAVFLIGIGAPLRMGIAHDGRAPDYDDWTAMTEKGPGLNGDILVWNPVLGQALELSSMGIRVNAKSLLRQLELTKTEDRKTLPFHRKLLAGNLPQTMGGGIGQSRLCMQLLGKAHIGEVQVSLWPENMRMNYLRNNISLL